MSPKKEMDAAERGYEMFAKTKQCDLPAVAWDYAQFLCKRSGGCGEVLLTAFAHYAQEMEGLPCRNSLYQSTDMAKAFFAGVRSAKQHIPG